MKILFAASEAVPFCKTGGLADVAGALPLALKAKKHDVRLVLPKYRAVDAKAHGLKKLDAVLRIPLGDDIEEVFLWEGLMAGKVPAYFIDAPKYFDRDGLYVDAAAKDHPDNEERFILFARAALEAAKALDFRPDIVHCHDWQTGLIPAYLETVCQLDAFFLPTASVLTIHNIAYQGIFPKNTLFEAGFSWKDFTPEKLEYYDQVNFLKAGLVYAHGLNTVSPTYAREVSAGPEFGRGMEGVLLGRGEDFTGILNGLDDVLWDPSADSLIAAPFSAKKPEGRAACRADLQKAAGLTADPKAPILGFVSRLDPQKGVDIVLDSATEQMEAGAQAVFLGSGSPAQKASMQNFAKQFPGRAAFFSDFSEPLAHRIYAGADLFLMPSRFEPCGLGQLIALRYGCVPVVTPTGGLADTVDPSVGFVASAVTAEAYSDVLRDAVDLFRRDPAAWAALRARGMSLDLGWGRSVPAYIKLYQRAQERKRSLSR